MVDPIEEGLPRGIALTWGVAERPQRGPKRELSIERIVEAAIEIADDEGLAAVSMSRVATSLGYTTMSLYRYVTSKDDLLVLMQDDVATVPLPDERDGTEWRQALRDWVNANITVYREHPWYVDIPISGEPMTPGTLAFIDAALGAMRELPLSDDEKMGTILLLSSFTIAWGRLERDAKAGNAGDSVGSAAIGAALMQLVSPERFPHLSPMIQAGHYLRGAGEGIDDFSYGLDRILDGVQAHISRDPTALAPKRPAGKPAREIEYTRDSAIRDATKARREAESKAREAAKRERELIGKARERAAKALERETERAKREAERANRD